MCLFHSIMPFMIRCQPLLQNKPYWHPKNSIQTINLGPFDISLKYKCTSSTNSKTKYPTIFQIPPRRMKCFHSALHPSLTETIVHGYDPDSIQCRSGSIHSRSIFSGLGLNSSLILGLVVNKQLVCFGLSWTIGIRIIQ